MNNTVAVVIINWNGQKLLKRFLPSVINFSEEAKIYIIDNFSTDNSIQFVNKNYPKIKIINLNKNYGYAEGYNLGLKHVKEDIYILLNNDIEVTKNWIKPIIENFKHYNIDIAQPLLLDLKNPDYVKMDKSFIRSTFMGEFNPSRGDLVFSQTGELLGIMANSQYCHLIKSVDPVGAVVFGKNDYSKVAKTLRDMHKLLAAKPSELR